MPIMQQNNPGELARIMCYGEPFTRKTWWALRAAELGYNVILCDFDNGAHIAKHLPIEALKRIFRIDMRTPNAKTAANCGFATLSLALKGGKVYYDDESRTKATAKSFNTDSTYTEFNLLEATPKDILILDSWTSMCSQLNEFNEKGIDPLKVDDFTEQSYYKQTRTFADRVISGLQRLPCHTIIIGHEIEYAKRKADAKAAAKPDEAIEWIKASVSSVTKAHGYQMAKDASDTLQFYIANAMQGVYVSTKPTNGAIVGSRSVAPTQKPWEELGVEHFLPTLSEISDNFDSKAVSTVTGAEIIGNSQSAGAATLNATKTPQIKIGNNT